MKVVSIHLNSANPSSVITTLPLPVVTATLSLSLMSASKSALQQGLR